MSRQTNGRPTGTRLVRTDTHRVVAFFSHPDDDELADGPLDDDPLLTVAAWLTAAIVLVATLSRCMA